LVQAIPPITTSLIKRFTTVCNQNVCFLQHHTLSIERKGKRCLATCSSYSPTSLAEPTISKSHEKHQTTFINSTVLAFYKASTHHTAPGLINLQQTTQRKTPISTTPKTLK
jgi:hypothetical protein